MTETCSHPKGSLVVPQKVIPAFAGSLLPRNDVTAVETKKTGMGRLKTSFRKATGIISPVVTLSSFSWLFYNAHTIPNPDMFTLTTVTLGSTVGIVTGWFGTAVSLTSFQNGDRKYFPLPATKEYLEREENKQKALITPFKEWDSIFAKNDDRMQKMLTPGK